MINSFANYTSANIPLSHIIIESPQIEKVQKQNECTDDEAVKAGRQ